MLKYNYPLVLFLSVVALKFLSMINNQVYESSRAKVEQFDYDINVIKRAPLIFIGGSERSGTTLTRALLDVHDSIKCGTEVKK
jgi:hypothetical protein